jgi:hypothetical protein
MVLGEWGHSKSLDHGVSALRNEIDVFRKEALKSSLEEMQKRSHLLNWKASL